MSDFLYGGSTGNPRDPKRVEADQRLDYLDRAETAYRKMNSIAKTETSERMQQMSDVAAFNEILCRFDRGDCFAQDGRHTEAVSDLMRAVQLCEECDPMAFERFFKLYVIRAKCWFSLGKITTKIEGRDKHAFWYAIDDYKLALAGHPELFGTPCSSISV